MKLTRLGGFEGKAGFSLTEALELIAIHKINEPILAILSGPKLGTKPLCLVSHNSDTANVTLNKYILLAERYSLFKIED